jgi:hypothetical protein
MGAIEILLSVVCVTAAGFGVTFGTSGTVAGEFLFARVCFVVAATALIAAYVTWLVKTRRKPLSPIARQITLGLLVSAFVLIGLPWSLWWVHAREQSLIAPDEDLRVSFQIRSQQPNHLDITYLFLNLGKQSALVNAIGLYEIVAKNKQDDPSKNISLCDSATPESLITLQMAIQIMGPGAQVGRETLTALYVPETLSVDGTPSDLKVPVSIESGKTRAISAAFTIEPNHTKEHDVIVFCPLVGTLDIKNIGGSSICRAISITRTGNRYNQSSSTARFRVLPHSQGASCPLAAQ